MFLPLPDRKPADREALRTISSEPSVPRVPHPFYRGVGTRGTREKASRGNTEGTRGEHGNTREHGGNTIRRRARRGRPLARVTDYPRPRDRRTSGGCPQARSIPVARTPGRFRLTETRYGRGLLTQLCGFHARDSATPARSAAFLGFSVFPTLPLDTGNQLSARRQSRLQLRELCSGLIGGALGGLTRMPTGSP